MNAQEAAKQAIDRIGDQLVELTMNLEIERGEGDPRQMDWSSAGELNEISRQLEQVIEFWNGGDTDA